MRNDAVEAVVGSGRRDDDHLALCLAESSLLQHERIVVGEERTELVGPVRESQEDVRYEPRLLPDLQYSRADILRQVFELGNRVSTD